MIRTLLCENLQICAQLAEDLREHWLGSAMIVSLHVHFATLVYINAGTTVVAALVALALPKALVSIRDRAESDVPP